MGRLKMTNALTVDVEDYFQVAAFSDEIQYANWDSYQLRVETNTNRLLDLFDAYQIKATFFILGWVAERVPGLVRRIHDQGHEIACHGYSHQLIYKQDIKTFTDETRKAKQILEDISGAKVAGYRAASYSITRDSLWALDVLNNLGFVYDSSIVPVHHDYYGIPDMPRFPYNIDTPDGNQLIEFPPSTISLPLMNLPVGGGGYFRLFPYWFTQRALHWINNHDNMPFVFYLHPWEIDIEQPRINAGLLSRFRHYNNLSKCYERLEKLLNQFQFSTVSDVLQGKQCKLQVAAQQLTSN